MSDFKIDNGIITEYTGKDVDIIIPYSINRVTVIGIADNVFNAELEPAEYDRKDGEMYKGATLKDNLIKTLQLPDGIQTLGDKCFANNNIQEINLPKDIVSLGEYCFANNNIHNLNINNVEKIRNLGKDCFINNYVQFIDIPKNNTGK